jgi:hypothetical protein
MHEHRGPTASGQQHIPGLSLRAGWSSSPVAIGPIIFFEHRVSLHGLVVGLSRMR